MSLKSDILALLERHRGVLMSGQAIADSSGVSRAAVWKAVCTLQREGYPIEGVSGNGYRLSALSDMLSAEGVRAFLPQDYPSLRLEVFGTLPSTNTYLKKAALDGAPHGSVVLADSQSAGRGRLGRSFFSPSGTGIYMSALVRPKSHRQLFTVSAAVAACRVTEKLVCAAPRIKWVNDIYLGGKKLAGILTEATVGVESGEPESVVIGIGLNVSTSADAFPPELRDSAVSLFPRGVPRNRIAAELICALFAALDEEASAILDEYRRRSLVLGREVAFICDGKPTVGTAQDIDDAGNLIVRIAGRGSITLAAGDVSLQKGRS